MNENDQETLGTQASPSAFADALGCVMRMLLDPSTDTLTFIEYQTGDSAPRIRAVLAAFARGTGACMCSEAHHGDALDCPTWFTDDTAAAEPRAEITLQCPFCPDGRVSKHLSMPLGHGDDGDAIELWLECNECGWSTVGADNTFVLSIPRGKAAHVFEKSGDHDTFCGRKFSLWSPRIPDAPITICRDCLREARARLAEPDEPQASEAPFPIRILEGNQR